MFIKICCVENCKVFSLRPFQKNLYPPAENVHGNSRKLCTNNLEIIMDLDGGKWKKSGKFPKIQGGGVTVNFYMHKNDETHVMRLDISLKIIPRITNK